MFLFEKQKKLFFYLYFISIEYFMIEARKAKIIFLGDSTVGKSSIISAINHADINSLHEVICIPSLANHWDRFLHKMLHEKQKRVQAAILGYSWTREIQIHHAILRAKFQYGGARLRHNKYLFLN